MSDTFEKQYSKFSGGLEDMLRHEPKLGTTTISREVWEELHRLGLFNMMIPEEYGGKLPSSKVPKETISKLSMQTSTALGYHSLPLALGSGISRFLFLLPVAKWGTNAIKQEVLPKFVSGDALIGALAMTEKKSGTDLFRQMETLATKNGDDWHVEGEKRWQGHSGVADYYLVGAKDEKALRSMYLVDGNMDGVSRREKYDTFGLNGIQYGQNSFNVDIPVDYRCERDDFAIIDVISTSRLFGFLSLSGFIKRLEEQTHQYATQRAIGNGTLNDLDECQYRLVEMQSWQYVCNALQEYISQNFDLRENNMQHQLLANIAKVLSTEYALKAALSAQQLCGSSGYHNDNYAARAVKDVRAFTIFEGTNDYLYNRIAIDGSRGFATNKDICDFSELGEWQNLLPEKAINGESHKHVLLGKIFARLIAMKIALDHGENNCKKRENAMIILESELAKLKAAYERCGNPLRYVTS